MSAIIDDRTENFGLPLPHHQNNMAEDCERLRQSLQMLDATLGSLGTEWTTRLAEFSAQIMRLSMRVATLEIAQGTSSGSGSGAMLPSGYELPGGTTVTPITVTPEGTEPVPGAALTFIVDSSGSTGE